MADYVILMGDIVASSSYAGDRLRQAFMAQIEDCNAALQEGILSPYTITLGDEFQGVAASLRSALEALFYLEEHIPLSDPPFQLRYVIVHGEIDTPINPKKAYAMMGPGLTQARQMLTDKRRGQQRFRCSLSDAFATTQFGRLFLVLESLIGRWSRADAELIRDMIANPHNGEVGRLHGKNRSQIWKRRKHLLVEEYRALKAAILDMPDACLAGESQRITC